MDAQLDTRHAIAGCVCLLSGDMEVTLWACLNAFSSLLVLDRESLVVMNGYLDARFPALPQAGLMLAWLGT